MLRRPIIAGNWKMNLDIPAAVLLCQELVLSLTTSKRKPLPDCDIIIAPTMLALAKAADALAVANARLRVTSAKTTAPIPQISLAAQDLHWEDDGAFTGKISASMLASIKIPYALVGHSEQRQYFHETDENVAKKTKKLLLHGISPIICIGETLAERKSGHLKNVLRRQLQTPLDGLSKDELAKIIIAYEPVWAIGTGISASHQEAEDAHVFVRTVLTELSSQEIAEQTRILYGGSVKESNARVLLACPNIDGALVGAASLQSTAMLSIIEALP